MPTCSGSTSTLAGRRDRGADAVIPAEGPSLFSDVARKPFIDDYGDSFVLGVLTLASDPSEVEPGTGMLVCVWATAGS